MNLVECWRGRERCFNPTPSIKVIYLGYVQPGTAYLAVLGIGDYIGTAYIPFTIDRAELLGDVDGDGVVAIIDATFIQRKLAGIPTADFNKDAADADEDGRLTVIDATFIQRWLAHLPSSENIGKPIA